MPESSTHDLIRALFSSFANSTIDPTDVRSPIRPLRFVCVGRDAAVFHTREPHTRGGYATLAGPYHFEVETHPAVEMPLYHQAEKRRLLAGLLNMQHDMPPIPVGAVVRVQVPEGRRATTVVRVPVRKAIAFEKAGPYVQFRLEPFPVIAMALVEYE